MFQRRNPAAAPSTALEQEKPRAINERLLLIGLAAIQFTAVVDFLIILPLGPQYMRVFSLQPAQFGVIVSAHAMAAGISGVVVSVCIDLLDRKRALLCL